MRLTGQFEMRFAGQKNANTHLKNKVAWLSENSERVSNALRSEGVKITQTPNIILFGFLTYFPSPASYFMDDVPCIALTEFIDQYCQAKVWPYKAGVATL